MKLKLTHVEGSKKGTVDNFDVPVVTVGRDPSNVLVFDPVKDDRVSTKHAALSEQGGTVIVTDLGSRNGTLVNGHKISGPTPVSSGGLVQFGENGPMVLVAYETAAAPAAAPPPAKKGGGGCAILFFLFLLVLGGVAVGAFLLLRGRHKDPWAHYGVGSSFVTTMETHMEKPVVMDTKVEMKQTVVARTDEAVKLKVETTTGGNTSTTEIEIPLHPKGEEKAVEKPLEERRESVTVPAGTFDCHYEKRKRDTATTESWLSDEVPVPVKTVSSTETMKSTLTLVKVEKK